MMPHPAAYLLSPYAVPPIAMVSILDSVNLKEITSLGIGGVIALVMFWFWVEARKDDNKRRDIERAEENKRRDDEKAFREQMIEELMHVVKDNTTANTALIQTTNALLKLVEAHDLNSRFSKS